MEKDSYGRVAFVGEVCYIGPRDAVYPQSLTTLDGPGLALRRHNQPGPPAGCRHGPLGMAWIQVRNDLPDDTRILRVAHVLKCESERVLGCFVKLWILADKHTLNGKLGIPAEVVDQHVNCPGFAAAAVSIDWLATGADGMTIPRFSEKNGESHKARLLKAQRQGRWRKGRGVDGPPSTDAPTSRLREGVPEQQQQQESEKDLVAQKQTWESALSALAADACPEALLKACGIGGKPLGRLVRGGVTAERIRAVAAEAASQNGAIRKPAGFIASTLSEEFKISIGKSTMLESDRAVIASIEKARARARGGA